MKYPSKTTKQRSKSKSGGYSEKPRESAARSGGHNGALSSMSFIPAAFYLRFSMWSVTRRRRGLYFFSCNFSPPGFLSIT